MSNRNIWFISDTHFGHAKIIEYCRPQFANVSEMDEAMITNWNAVVKAEDLVYHLGDFAWTPQHAKRVRPMLNGTIRLIVGNHDDVPALAGAGLFQDIAMWKQFREHGFTATHLPIREDQIRHGAVNFHGHVHGNQDGLGPMHQDFSVESIGYTPLNLDELLPGLPTLNAMLGWTK